MYVFIAGTMAGGMHPPLIVGKGDEGPPRVTSPKASAHIGSVFGANFTTNSSPTYAPPYPPVPPSMYLLLDKFTDFASERLFWMKNK